MLDFELGAEFEGLRGLEPRRETLFLMLPKIPLIFDDDLSGMSRSCEVFGAPPWLKRTEVSGDTDMVGCRSKRSYE